MNTENQSITKGMSDEEIIELYWNRNEDAISQTDKKYGKFLFTIAYNIIHDRLDGEECVNDTYLGVWNRIPPTRPNAFKAFIARITRNIAIDRFRAKTSDKRIPSELTVSLEELDNCAELSPSVDEELAVRELSRVINDYLRTLDDRDEFVFVCRYYFSDRIATIAKMQGVSEATVYKALAGMRSSLKALLEKEGLFHE